MAKKATTPKKASKAAPIVAEGKEVPKQWQGMARDEKGLLKRKGVGITPKGASTKIKQRFGKLIYKVLKEELTEDKLRRVVSTMIDIATEYPDHKDAARVGEFLMRLGTDPDKSNEDATTNVNITINAIRENAVAARALAGLKPINVQVIKASSDHAGGDHSGAHQQQPVSLPGPAAAGPE